MFVSKVLAGSVWVVALSMGFAAGGCKGGARGGQFEGNWVMTASVTGQKSLDDMTKKNFANYHKKYLLGREGGGYFFQPVGNPNAPKEKLQLKDGKLVSEDSWMRVEYELQDGKLVASYIFTATKQLSHRVTFTRE